jgi:hypothetical protein
VSRSLKISATVVIACAKAKDPNEKKTEPANRVTDINLFIWIILRIKIDFIGAKIAFALLDFRT